MKILIEDTIKILGIGTPVTTTIFNSTNQNDENYYDISRCCDKTYTILFKYDDNTIILQDKIRLIIPNNLSEIEVKDFIIVEINNYLM